MQYKVNADFTLNVNTFVDGDDLNGDESEEAIKEQAKHQIFAGNYDPGDPCSDPKINWVEEDK